MSQTSGKPCSFPVPILAPRRRQSLSTQSHQSVRGSRVDALRHQPKCLLHSADLPYVQTRRSNPVSVTSLIELGAGIKSP
jgi:hypothetical protein